MKPVFGAAGLVLRGTTTSNQSARSLTTMRTVPAFTIAAVPRKFAVQIVDSFCVTRIVVCATAGAAPAASMQQRRAPRVKAFVILFMTPSLREALPKQRAARLDE